MQKSLLILLSFQLLTFMAFANESEKSSLLLLEVERAKLISRENPKYPKDAARRNQEGWVELSYVIDEEGNVIDPVVIDSSGERQFEINAKYAIKKWKFEPATQDGKPIQQCDSKLRLDFTLSGNADKSVRSIFRNLYIKADKAVIDNKIDEAKELLSKIKSRKIWNRAENAWYWMLAARVAELENDLEVELASLHRANNNMENDFLGEENHNYNLYKTFILELQTNKYPNAIRTFLKLSKRKNAERYIEASEPYYLKALNVIASNKPLIQKLNIGEHGTVQHQLYRNSFTIANVSGEIDMLDIRCNNKRTKFAFGAEKNWTIPKAWGQCHVLVEGDEGASFDIVEVDKQENTQA